jgi:GrpB-like predicted nucleotidyltransferase (UPF0157 family)
MSAEEEIRIATYDAAWPSRFEAERALLAPILAPWLAGPIEHIGSTAVPGLAAKPVIDIMAAVASLDASRDAIHSLEALSYQYFPYKPESMHWFCKPGPALRTHHLHLVPFGSDLWRERLAFRDRLREDAALRGEYEALKRELAGLHRKDREAYTDAKAAFVARVTTMAVFPLKDPR